MMTGRPGRSGRPPRHGGAAAVRDLTAGVPFTGLAAREEQGVRDQVESEGRAAIVLTQAARLTAASNLYWAAVQKAADTGDLEALDRYCGRFGWLAQAALRAWAEVRKETGNRRGTLADLLKPKVVEDGN